MLSEFIELNRDEIIRRCRAKVASRLSPPPTPAEIDHGVPLFLGQLIHALHLGVSASEEIGDSALLHGADMLRQGFTASQVVHDYGDVCQSITELAVEMNAPIATTDFRVLNGCLDNAIAGAVTEFSRDRRTPFRRERGDGGDDQANGFFIHELRNLLNTSLIAFNVIKSGNVGVSGSTGTVLHRNLSAACDLIARSVAGVRLAQGQQDLEFVLLSTFIANLTEAGTLSANALGIAFVVETPAEDATIEVDAQALMAVVMNLVQNAIKFTAPKSTVTLRTKVTEDRVRLEVQDQCGGLPLGDTSDLFRPFERRGTNRSGLGLGLAFSKFATELNKGRLYAVSLPDDGCIFTVDLPRCAIPAGSL
jgi:signal transduction histidine kinase